MPLDGLWARTIPLSGPSQPSPTQEDSLGLTTDILHVYPVQLCRLWRWEWQCISKMATWITLLGWRDSWQVEDEKAANKQIETSIATLVICQDTYVSYTKLSIYSSESYEALPVSIHTKFSPYHLYVVSFFLWHTERYILKKLRIPPTPKRVQYTVGHPSLQKNEILF